MKSILKNTYLVILLVVITSTLNAQQQGQCPCCDGFVRYKTTFAPDSVKKFKTTFFSLYMGVGEGTANYNGLQPYGYYGKTPYNMVPQFLIDIKGSRNDKYYISFQLRGTCSLFAADSGAPLTATMVFMSLNIGEEFYRNPYSKFLNAIYGDVGVNYGQTDINNFVETQGGKSLGEAVLPTASLSFDLFQWYSKIDHMDSKYAKTSGVGCLACTLKLGYALQIGRSSCCPELPYYADLNMGGFYATLGITIDSYSNLHVLHT